MVDHFDVQEWFKRCRKTLLGSRASNGPNCLVNNTLLIYLIVGLDILGLEMTILIQGVLKERLFGIGPKLDYFSSFYCFICIPSIQN